MYPNGAVILNFYRAKVVTAGNTENTGTLSATNFSGPSEIKDCGFLKNLQANYLPCVSFEPTLLPAHKRSTDDGYTGIIKKIGSKIQKAVKAKDSGCPK